jgi:hypothetical protein
MAYHTIEERPEAIKHVGVSLSEENRDAYLDYVAVKAPKPDTEEFQFG